MSENDYSKYVVQDLKAPFSPEVNTAYSKIAKRILWMDDKVVPGAFQMNCSWYFKTNEKSPPVHTHNVGEILGFFGGDPDDCYNLNGEVEMWMGDEQFLLTKSTLLFAPAGIKHCPLVIWRVDRPIFHFSIVTGGTYGIKTDD